MADKKKNFLTRLRDSEEGLCISYWFNVGISSFFAALCGYGTWAMAVYSVSNPNAGIFITVLIFAVWTWFQVKNTIVWIAYALLQQKSRANDFARIDFFISRTITILQRLPLVGVTELVYLEASLALFRQRQGFFESTQDLLDKAIDRTRKAADRASFRNRSELRAALGVLVCYRASISLRLRAYAEAEQLALESRELLLKTKHKVLKAYSVAPFLVLGWIRLKQNEIDQSAEFFEQAYERIGSFIESGDSTDFRMQNVLRSVHLSQALVEASKENFEKSLSHFQQALDITGTGEYAGSDNMQFLLMLAEKYMAAGLHSEAESALKMSYSIGKFGSFHPDAIITLDTYEKLLRLTGRDAEVDDMRHWLFDTEELKIALRTK